MIFTKETKNKIISQGGVIVNTLDRKRMRNVRYVICVQNDLSCSGEIPERNGAIFFIGIVSHVSEYEKDESHNLYFIHIESYALLENRMSDLNWKNPVRYAADTETGINISKIVFFDMPKSEEQKTPERIIKPLTIREAKEGIAKKLGISIDSIKIIIEE